MKAVIISDQEGNRLRPITCTKPKSMIPVLGRPVSEYTLRLLKRHNLTDVSIVTGYLSDEIKKYYNENAPQGINISYIEKKDLRTIISESDTLIISGSLITDTNLEDFIEFHRTKKGIITLAARSHISPEPDYGRLCVDSRYLAHFNSDTDKMLPQTHMVGIMIISAHTHLPDFTSVWDIPKKLASSSEIYACFISGYTCDISESGGLFKCTRDFLDKKINLPLSFEEKEPGVWIHQSAEVCRGSVIVPPVFIDKGALISRGARIESYSVIGKNSRVGNFADIKRSIIMENAHIGDGSGLRGAIICESSETGADSAVYEGCILGSNSHLGCRSVLKPNVRVWPEKHIDDELHIKSNIVWGSAHPEISFSEGSAQGRINIEITPEFSSMLGSAATRELGEKIAVSADGGGASCMIKNALIAGVQSSGGIAYDFGEQPLPITRSGIRFYSLNGGIAVTSFTRDGEMWACLDIINSAGSNVNRETSEKIRRPAAAGDFQRVDPSAVAETEYFFEYKLYYLKQLINSTTKKELGCKLLIHSPNIWAENLLKSAADDLKCEFHFTRTSREDAFCDELKHGKYDFGAILDHKCETLTLITNSGHVLSEFEYSALTALIIMKSYRNAVIYAPLTSPDCIELLAKKYGATVHRTPINPPHLMNELSRHQEKMFMRQFIYRFDAFGALIMLMDFMCSSGLTLPALLREIPKTYMVSASVGCPQCDISKKIEHLHDRFKAVTETSDDGIRLSFDNGWVLVIPYRMHSAIRIISHGNTEEYARELSDICIDDISK